MAWVPETNWKPTRLMEVAGSVDSSTGATVVTTDAGRAYIKPLGNRQGPQCPSWHAGLPNTQPLPYAVAHQEPPRCADATIHPVRF